VGQVDSPDVKPLIPNARDAEAAWYRKTGIYPINHTVVVKDSLLRDDPTLAPRLFTAFTEAKAVLLRQLASGGALPADAQGLAQRRTVVGDDPLPYGLARNRTAIEAVIRFARDQKILPRTVAPEDVFARNTLDLPEPEGASRPSPRGS
jgi:4,5-dihydroxyphthalate decarboxylase